MKKILFALLVLACCLSVQSIYAQTPLLIDDFNYSNGNLVGNGFWVQTGATATAPIQVIGGSLSYPDYQSSGLYSSVQINTSGQDINDSCMNLNSGSIYCSFLVKVTAAQATGDYFFHLSDRGTSSFYARFFAKNTGGNLLFGLAYSSGTGNTTVYLPTNYYFDSTYLVVIKYVFVTGALNDTACLWINPTIGGSEPTPDLSLPNAPTSTVADAIILKAVCLRQGSSGNAATLVFDGLRVATSWEDIPLPVQLESFSSSLLNARQPLLLWTTSSEVNNAGFEIERTKKNQNAWNKIGFVFGSGSTNEPRHYSFADAELNSGSYQYRLKQIDYNGNFEYFYLPNDVTIANPHITTLDQNYPNPCNPTTNISFDLSERSFVTLKVYDILGKEIITLLNKELNADFYEIPFNASNLASGTYFYALSAGSFNSIKKMLVVK